ncbi:MAG: DUF5519 family protein [Flavobacteriales bacterium]|nr:DUF5519 family protein [Flavobacteriales bacterium]
MEETAIVTTVEKRFRMLKHVPFLPIIFDEHLKIYTMIFRPKVYKKMMAFAERAKQLMYVSTTVHRYGGLQFNIDDKEIGHMHGDGLVDIRLNKYFAGVIISLGLAEEHHVIKNAGWISFQIKRNQDLNVLDKIVELAYALRLNLDTNRLMNRLVL